MRNVYYIIETIKSMKDKEIILEHIKDKEYKIFDNDKKSKDPENIIRRDFRPSMYYVPVHAEQTPVYEGPLSATQLFKEVEQLRGDLEQARAEKSQDAGKIAGLEKRLADLQRQHVADESRIRDANATIRDANSRINSLREQTRLAEERARQTQASEAPDVSFAALGLDPRTAFVGLTEAQIATLVTGVQRVRAKIHHPDVGGDTTRMRNVNAAADKLRNPRTRPHYKR